MAHLSASHELTEVVREVKALYATRDSNYPYDCEFTRPQASRYQVLVAREHELIRQVRAA